MAEKVGAFGWREAKTMTFLAALRFDRVEAPWLIDGPIRYRDHGQAQLAQGCRFPPYSPDLNPIEQAFAKLKALLRANALRTVGALWKALGELVACLKMLYGGSAPLQHLTGS
jgi:hypothetical protein